MEFTPHFEAPLSPLSPPNSVQNPSLQTPSVQIPSDSTASTHEQPLQETPFPETPLQEQTAEKTRVYERLARSLNHSLWNRLKSKHDAEENQ